MLDRSYFVLACLQAVARQGSEAVSVRLGVLSGQSQAQLGGFKVRALKTTVRMSQERRWQYEVEWSCMTHDAPPASATLELLVIGDVPPNLASHGYTIMVGDEGMISGGQWDAVAFTFSLSSGAVVCVAELRVVDAALHLLQAQAVLAAAPAVWLCTTATQPLSQSSVHTNAGLWGLARACRQERTALPAWCVDVRENAEGVATVIRQHTLRLPSGSVRGLHLSTSVEPEAAFHTANLYVPRLVAPYDAQPLGVDVAFAAVCRLLDAHTSNAMAALDMERLPPAYALLETLCQQYLLEAVHALQESKVPVWHHKLLYAWCAKQPPPSDRVVAPVDVRAAHADLWAEVQLAERCGPLFVEALSSRVAFQELLFPGGSMDAVLPVYEHAVGGAFYNGCVVAAVEAVLALLSAERRVMALEVGAGTGGTASSVLPILESACERYIFTDVSDVFLRKARVRFTDFPFLEYTLLNIDADPRLQGFAPHQCDIIIATNVLHATPFMRNTLHNCEQLLRSGGMLVVNEALATAAFLQITFGMTDGWWLFGESRDPERVGQDSPLLSWRQWQALLVDSGFHHAHCMQGETFLRGQAVIVAQVPTPGNDEPVALDEGTHFFSGGLGGLGLLTARLLVEGGAIVCWQAAKTIGHGSPRAVPTCGAFAATLLTTGTCAQSCVLCAALGCGSAASSMRRISSPTPHSPTRTCSTSVRRMGPRCTAQQRFTLHHGTHRSAFSTYTHRCRV
jgi:SAM-dependent methyltransferase